MQSISKKSAREGAWIVRFDGGECGVDDKKSMVERKIRIVRRVK